MIDSWDFGQACVWGTLIGRLHTMTTTAQAANDVKGVRRQRPYVRYLSLIFEEEEETQRSSSFSVYGPDMVVKNKGPRYQIKCTSVCPKD